MKLEFSQKISNFSNFMKIRPSKNRVVPYERTDGRTDGRTDRQT